MIKKKYIYAVVVAAIIFVGGFVAYYVLNPNYTITGTIIDTESGQGIGAVKIQTDNQEVTSTDDGTYEINGVKKDTVLKYIVPPIYQPVEVSIDYENGTKTSFHTVQITKDLEVSPTEEERASRVRKEVDVIFKDFMFGRYAEEYDLMHPDSQKLISKEDFVKSAQDDLKNVSLTDYKIGDIRFLDTWHAAPLNKDYSNVVEVDVSYTAQFLGISQTINQTTHYVKVDGKWRWFRTPSSGS